MYKRSLCERNERGPWSGQGTIKRMAASSSDQPAHANPLSSETEAGAIAVIGGGSIGTAFALLFAAAGRTVQVQDIDAARRDAILPTIAGRLADLRQFGLTSEPVDAILARLTVVEDLAAAVEGADYVQECAPEDLDLKRGLFARLDRLARPEATLASASSAIPASRIAERLPGRSRCLVVHPGNPPYLVKVAEVVPAPFTDEGVTARTEALLRYAGMTPIRVGREVEGFVFNRLQGALLREAYCLVRDGVAGVEDIDRLVRDGLGLRWSVIGPFETADLNTRGGIAAHAQRLGPAYARMGAERGQHDPWTPDLVAKVEGERRRQLSLDSWEERLAWRDREMMRLLAHRRADRS
jgi:3-hydroxyacyl-CoA dehydrogenase